VAITQAATTNSNFLICSLIQWRNRALARPKAHTHK
jgi:hypothetical protein